VLKLVLLIQLGFGLRVSVRLRVRAIVGVGNTLRLGPSGGLSLG
jgi:hypothetical protein